MARRSLVVVEVSLSLVLIIGAALLMLSFVRLQRVEPGFDSRRVVTAGVVLPLPGAFDPARDGPGWARFFGQLMLRLRHSPGVVAAGAVSSLPLSGAVESSGTTVVGQPQPALGQAPQAQYSVIDGDYFGAMGIRVVAGRVFDARDVANGVQTIIVSREFVRRYLNGAQPLEARITCGCEFSTGGPRAIVGVVDDVRQTTLDSPVEPQVYLPESQMPYPGLHLVVRGTVDRSGIVPLIKREVSTLDPRLAVSDARTLEEVVDESLARQRFSMTIIAIFAASALVLAMVGLYGVIALSVGQRRREIAVRVALGARPADVLRLVVGEGFRIAVAGVAIGLAGALATSRLLSALLYGVSARSGSVYSGATAGIVFVTLLATYLPARRAMRVDPTSALKSD